MGFSRPGLGKRGAARVRWCFGFRAQRPVVVGRAVVVGHAQATSRPIRSRSVGQRTSHRSGRVSSALNGREREREFLAPSFCLPRSARPFLTLVPFSLSRRRKRVSAPFFCLFLICRHLSSSFLPSAFLRATVVSRKERGESEKRRTHQSSCDPGAKCWTGGRPP